MLDLVLVLRRKSFPVKKTCTKKQIQSVNAGLTFACVSVSKRITLNADENSELALILRLAMVGKPVPPKTTPKDDTYKLAEQGKSVSPPITQGAASAAAGTSLQSRHRNESVDSEKSDKPRVKPPGRLVSLDAFRGFIMIMLAATGFGVAGFAGIDESSPVWNVHNHEYWQKLSFHFEHPAWRSAYDDYKVSFWDLIQPSFMFMVGVAMPFSYARRSQQQQHSTFRLGLHALVRSVALVLIGVFLQSNGRQHTTWEFPNVLCQIGLGYFFAWCLLNFRPLVQVVALVVILVGYWALFFFNPPAADYDYASVSADKEKGEVFEGKLAAWSKNANAAFYFDRWLLPQLRTVPEPDSAAADANAMSPQSSQWLPVVLTTAGDEKAKQSDAATTETASPGVEPAADAAIPEAVPQETPAELQPTPETLETRTTAETPAATQEPLVPAGPGWFRRAFLHNDVAWTPNTGGYATLNFVPSIGTTILGMLCGQLLLAGSYSHLKKLGILIVAAGLCLGLGILADMTVCPIVKRIWTPSWVLFSGGYVIGMLALFYLLFDIAPLKLLAFPLVVVGMNSILMYMLGQTVGGWTKNSLIKVHLAGLIENVFGPKALDPEWYAPVTLATGTFVVFWLFLYWLHRQRIYLRL